MYSFNIRALQLIHVSSPSIPSNNCNDSSPYKKHFALPKLTIWLQAQFDLLKVILLLCEYLPWCHFVSNYTPETWKWVYTTSNETNSQTYKLLQEELRKLKTNFFLLFSLLIQPSSTDFAQFLFISVSVFNLFLWIQPYLSKWTLPTWKTNSYNKQRQKPKQISLFLNYLPWQTSPAVTNWNRQGMSSISTSHDTANEQHTKQTTDNWLKAFRCKAAQEWIRSCHFRDFLSNVTRSSVQIKEEAQVSELIAGTLCKQGMVIIKM